MSWVISVTGKVAAAGAKAVEGFGRLQYLQPDEKDLKDAAAALVAKALELQPAGTVVKIECSGHAISSGTGNTQRVSVLVEPVLGFVED